MQKALKMSIFTKIGDCWIKRPFLTSLAFQSVVLAPVFAGLFIPEYLAEKERVRQIAIKKELEKQAQIDRIEQWNESLYATILENNKNIKEEILNTKEDIETKLLGVKWILKQNVDKLRSDIAKDTEKHNQNIYSRLEDLSENVEGWIDTLGDKLQDEIEEVKTFQLGSMAGISNALSHVKSEIENTIRTTGTNANAQILQRLSQLENKLKSFEADMKEVKDNSENAKDILDYLMEEYKEIGDYVEGSNEYINKLNTWIEEAYKVLNTIKE